MHQTKKIIVEGGRMLADAGSLVWIGMWFIMATIQGFHNRYFWINIKINPFETDPYFFNDILPWACFK